MPAPIPLVALVMGSKSDWPTVKRTAETLEELGVPHSVSVMSAHRSPERVREFASGAEAAGLQVLIAAAGSAAHLAGVIAAHTALPVIGIPMESGSLGGLDALLSTVQMPGGVPVATVAIGAGGATNAAVLAAQIIALGNPAVKQRLAAYRAQLADKVRAADEELRREIGPTLGRG
jgi:5-(carboxyamino)imidazole ribonucleotide mutase